MKRTLIQHAILVNEGSKIQGSVLLEDGQIAALYTDEQPLPENVDTVVDGTGCYLLPGVIDEHVHFRDPGLTQKADVCSESQAAAAGGVTSIMDMPNTSPQTTTLEAWEDKLALFAQKSSVNYTCYFGATNNNYPMFDQLNKQRVCGIKLFMGASTGNMLVDRMASLENIFQNAGLLIAVHCEDQQTIKDNTLRAKEQYGEDAPITLHPVIRSEEACYHSSALAVELAQKHNARLHILHISTAKELELLEKAPLAEKRITAEACISHLFFTDADYERLGGRIKCNPAIKTDRDRQALLDGLNNGLIDSIATDHAPHQLCEKEGGALKATSGMPSIQFSLVSMLEYVDKGVISLETVVEKMCHAPATMYQIDRRGFIRPGYHADLVLVRPEQPWTVTPEVIFSKCKWSPMEGHTFKWKVEKTWVNGELVYNNGHIDTAIRGQELRFNH